MSAPNVVILAGPNGAGKTTAAPNLLVGALEVQEFINSDTIAKGLSAFRSEGVAMQAGRIMLQRLHQLTAQRVNVAFESTLASGTFAPLARDRRLSIPVGFSLAPVRSRKARSIKPRTFLTQNFGKM